MLQWTHILKILESWTRNGEETMKNGARLISYAPHVGSRAWLHTIYPSLPDHDLAGIGQAVGKTVPSDVRDFWRCSNGIQLFSASLSIFGVRTSFVRSIENRQPFDIVEMNRPSECPSDASATMFFFGGYKWDGSKLYIDTAEAPLQTVYRCAPTSVRPLNTWTSLGVMLVEELNRLGELFGLDGKVIDETSPTAPDPSPSSK